MFTGQKPQKITAEKILPGSVSFLSFTFHIRSGTIFQLIGPFCRDQGKLTAYNNTLQSLNETYHTDLLRRFHGNHG